MFPGRSPSVIRRAARNLRCQSGNKDGFRNALRRFGTYGPIVRRVLKDAGLHQDIQYLPFVESSYNPEAYSRVGAAGMWQIMPRTARTLGLELNATMDERLDPEAASWGAARYLKDSRKNLTVAARSKKPKSACCAPRATPLPPANHPFRGWLRDDRLPMRSPVRIIGWRTEITCSASPILIFNSYIPSRHP